MKGKTGKTSRKLIPEPHGDLHMDEPMKHGGRAKAAKHTGHIRGKKPRMRADKKSRSPVKRDDGGRISNTNSFSSNETDETNNQLSNEVSSKPDDSESGEARGLDRQQFDRKAPEIMRRQMNNDIAQGHKRGGTIKIKKSHEGLLHKDTNTAKGKKIPEAKLEKAKNSKNPAVRKRATFAENAKHWNHG